MKPAYVLANDSERDRLGALLDRMSDDELGRRLPNGLTVADVLVHLAFWDGYACASLRACRDSGFTEWKTDFEAVNSSLQALAGAIPARAVVDLVRAAADSADREAAAASPELAEVLEAAGKGRYLERAQHRRAHLDQIEPLVP